MERIITSTIAEVYALESDARASNAEKTNRAMQKVTFIGTIFLKSRLSLNKSQSSNLSLVGHFYHRQSESRKMHSSRISPPIVRLRLTASQFTSVCICLQRRKLTPTIERRFSSQMKSQNCFILLNNLSNVNLQKTFFSSKIKMSNKLINERHFCIYENFTMNDDRD